MCFSPLISGDGDATEGVVTAVKNEGSCFSPLISGDGDATRPAGEDPPGIAGVSVPLLAGMGMQQTFEDVTASEYDAFQSPY